MSAEWQKALFFSLLFHFSLLAGAYYFSQPKEVKSVRVIKLSLRPASLPAEVSSKGARKKASMASVSKTRPKAKKTRAKTKTKVASPSRIKRTPPKLREKKIPKTISSQRSRKIARARHHQQKTPTTQVPSGREEELLARRLAALKEKAEEKKLAERIAALRGKMVKGGGLQLGESDLPPGLARRLTAHLKSFWEVPELLKDRRDLVAEVELVIEADGQIRSWHFRHRSGNRLYDEAVAASLKRANPLPAPGKAIKLSVVFRIQD